MPRSGPAPAPPLYCLRGSVEERERTWLLPAGESTLGSAEANDLVLAVQGVSRQHARLRVDGEGVDLTDLESTNGSFVNGERVVSARVGPGDELRFGPVPLTLQEIDPDDALLAFEIPPTPGEGRGESRTGLPDDQSTDRLADPPPGLAPGGTLGVERFLDRLATPLRRDAAAVLEALMRELHAGGACLLEEAGRREPLVVASCGRVGDPTGHPPWRALVEAVARSAGTSCRSGSAVSPPLAYAVLGRPRALPLSLLLFDPPAGEGTEELLRVTLRLFGWLPGWGAGPAASAAGRGSQLPALRFPPEFVVGATPAMARLYGEIRALCRGDLPVLLSGETGVGKEHVAKILHLSSERARGPFLAMNCAAIPADLLEAEMFGVTEGAATGVRAREGRFAQARGGVLFLDELGDMSLELQAKLLRAVQEKEIQPVGGRPAAVDVRIVAATNKDLLAEVEAGRFRSDLYYRIAGAVLTVPPLRQRREDIPGLVESFLHAAAKAADRGVRGLTLKALDTLVAYPWPGNVRELEHEIHRLVQACPAGQAIDSTMLPERFAAAALPAGEKAPEPDGSLRLERHVEDLERRLIRQALDESDGSQRKAAAKLGISRNALTRKMRRLGIVE